MAKKKKKDIEENIDNKEEFNDIDENFGLPDLDLETLDEISEDSVVEEEIPEEVNEVEEEQVSYEEEPVIVEEESVEEEVEEMPVVAQVADEETVDEDGYREGTSENEEKPAYVPGTYAAKAKEEESKSGKIIGVIVVLLLLAGVLWYFMYFQPEQQAAEKAKQEQINQQKAQQEKERIAEEKAAEEARLQADEEARLQAEEDAKPKIGTIETISEKTSRYYVVVSSGLDGDLAMDYAQKEVNNGTNIKLLSPLGTNKFYRVTVADHDTWVDAENTANDLKSTFGDGVWVLKY
jgi:phage-related minor tail protein